MSNRSFAVARGRKMALALTVSAFASLGTPFVAISSADPGAQNPVSATFGDCKNDNGGLHYGYVCPTTITTSSDDGSGGGVILT